MTSGIKLNLNLFESLFALQNPLAIFRAVKEYKIGFYSDSIIVEKSVFSKADLEIYRSISSVHSKIPRIKILWFEDNYVFFKNILRFVIDRARVLSYIANSCDKFLFGWILVRDSAIRVIEEIKNRIIERYKYFRNERPIGAHVPLNVTAPDFLDRLRETYGESINAEELANKFCSKEDILAACNLFLRFVRDYTPLLHNLMNEVICYSIRYHGARRFMIQQEVAITVYKWFGRRKSWTYQALNTLEKLGLIIRVQNLKDKRQKVVLPACITTTYGSKILISEDKKIEVEIPKRKNTCILCARGFKYTEKEAFTNAHRESIKEFLEILKSLGFKISKINEEHYNQVIEKIKNVPCYILRHVLSQIQAIIASIHPMKHPITIKTKNQKNNEKPIYKGDIIFKEITPIENIIEKLPNILERMFNESKNTQNQKEQTPGNQNEKFTPPKLKTHKQQKSIQKQCVRIDY